MFSGCFTDVFKTSTFLFKKHSKITFRLQSFIIIYNRLHPFTIMYGALALIAFRRVLWLCTCFDKK